jgi:hypothetical protein
MSDAGPVRQCDGTLPALIRGFFLSCVKFDDSTIVKRCGFQFVGGAVIASMLAGGLANAL